MGYRTGGQSRMAYTFDKRKLNQRNNSSSTRKKIFTGNAAAQQSYAAHHGRPAGRTGSGPALAGYYIFNTE